MCAYISKATSTNDRGDRLIASVQATQGDQMKTASIGDSSFEYLIFFLSYVYHALRCLLALLDLVFADRATESRTVEKYWRDTSFH